LREQFDREARLAADGPEGAEALEIARRPCTESTGLRGAEVGHVGRDVALEVAALDRPAEQLSERLDHVVRRARAVGPGVAQVLDMAGLKVRDRPCCTLPREQRGHHQRAHMAGPGCQGLPLGRCPVAAPQPAQRALRGGTGWAGALERGERALVLGEEGGAAGRLAQADLRPARDAEIDSDVAVPVAVAADVA
jgi:hypothetical protein